MPDFFWRAAGADGKVVTGQLDAPNEAAVLKQLRSKGLTPLAVQDAASAATSGMATAANASAAAIASAGFKQPKARVDKSPVKSKDVFLLIHRHSKSRRFFLLLIYCHIIILCFYCFFL